MAEHIITKAAKRQATSETLHQPPRSTVRLVDFPDADLPSESRPQQIDFILEIDRLKSVVRRASLLDRSRRENTAEHSWQIALSRRRRASRRRWTDCSRC